ncbi:sulfurtransferase [Nitratifractor sp.]
MKVLFPFFLAMFILNASDTIVSAQWLQKHLGDSDVKVIEMSDRQSYEFAGHIPGAILTSKSDWRQIDGDDALVHLPVKRLEKMIQNLGIDDKDQVVIYAKGQNLNELLGAHYLFWLFHYLGHTRVSMLDRGWSGWLENNGTISDETPPVQKGAFVARPLRALEISTAEIHAIRSFYTVIDGRPATHYQGEEKFPANTRYGRIPGSLSQPWGDYIRNDAKGRLFVDYSRLPPLLRHHTIDPKEPLILTCFGGTGASVDYVLFIHYGYRNIRLHDEGIRKYNAWHLPLVRSEF